MRKYALASPEHKRDVDLRDYEDVIVEAVMTAMKDAQIPKLFSSREVSCDKEEKNDARTKNRMGGHL